MGFDYSPSPNRLGEWAIDPALCLASVSSVQGFYNNQCQRKRTSGNYCKQHSPEEVARRRHNGRQKYHDQEAARERMHLAPLEDLRDRCADQAMAAAKLGMAPEGIRASVLATDLEPTRG